MGTIFIWMLIMFVLLLHFELFSARLHDRRRYKRICFMFSRAIIIRTIFHWLQESKFSTSCCHEAWPKITQNQNLHQLMLTGSMNEWQLVQHSILWPADYIFGRVYTTLKLKHILLAIENDFWQPPSSVNWIASSHELTLTTIKFMNCHIVI